MTRGLTNAAATAAQAEVVMRTVAVELLFDSGPVRVNGSPVSITIGGQEFLGLGTLGSISEIAEEAGLQSAGITLALSGIPSDAVALALAEPYQDRRGTVWEVWLDRATGQLISDPALIFRGRMDQMNVLLGAQNVVEVTLEDRLTDMDRPNLARSTDEDQQRDYPGDIGLQFVSATVEKEIVWPAASWRG
jgi:hypothetical protein